MIVEDTEPRQTLAEMLQEKMKILKPVPKQEKKVSKDDLQQQLEKKLQNLRQVPENEKKYSEFKQTWEEASPSKEPELNAKFNEALKKQLLFQARIAELAKIKRA